MVRTLVKIIIILTLVVITYVLLFLFFSSGHTFQQFNKVQTIDDWNITIGSTQGDFDSDGKEDLITNEGCAYLTKAIIDKIPQSNQCTDVYTNEMYKGQFPKIGQKYIFSKDYTYVAKKKNGNWLIESSFAPNKVEVYEIGNDGFLINSPAPLSATMDNILYRIIFAPIYAVDLVFN